MLSYYARMSRWGLQRDPKKKQSSVREKKTTRAVRGGRHVASSRTPSKIPKSSTTTSKNTIVGAAFPTISHPVPSRPNERVTVAAAQHGRHPASVVHCKEHPLSQISALSSSSGSARSYVPPGAGVRFAVHVHREQLGSYSQSDASWDNRTAACSTFSRAKTMPAGTVTPIQAAMQKMLVSSVDFGNKRRGGTSTATAPSLKAYPAAAQRFVTPRHMVTHGFGSLEPTLHQDSSDSLSNNQTRDCKCAHSTPQVQSALPAYAQSVKELVHAELKTYLDDLQAQEQQLRQSGYDMAQKLSESRLTVRAAEERLDEKMKQCERALSDRAALDQRSLGVYLEQMDNKMRNIDNTMDEVAHAMQQAQAAAKAARAIQHRLEDKFKQVEQALNDRAGVYLQQIEDKTHEIDKRMDKVEQMMQMAETAVAAVFEATKSAIATVDNVQSDLIKAVLPYVESAVSKFAHRFWKHSSNDDTRAIPLATEQKIVITTSPQRKTNGKRKRAEPQPRVPCKRNRLALANSNVRSTRSRSKPADVIEIGGPVPDSVSPEPCSSPCTKNSCVTPVTPPGRLTRFCSPREDEILAPVNWTNKQDWLRVPVAKNSRPAYGRGSRSKENLFEDSFSFLSGSN